MTSRMQGAAVAIAKRQAAAGPPVVPMVAWTSPSVVRSSIVGGQHLREPPPSPHLHESTGDPDPVLRKAVSPVLFQT